ncbi:WhiB family transcriptional regulator [Nocardiopsis flavescens]
MRATKQCAGCGTQVPRFHSAACGGLCAGCDDRWRRAGRPATGPPPSTRTATTVAPWHTANVTLPYPNRRLGAWTSAAACADHPDPELFFDADRADQARAVCASCPVRSDCSAHAAAQNEHGVWGT